MSSHLSTKKQVNISRLHQRYLLDRYFKKSVISNFFFSRKVFYFFHNFFFSFIFISRIKNFCFFSFRKRGILNFFHLSRMMFKYYAVHSYLAGVRKYSW